MNELPMLTVRTFIENDDDGTPIYDVQEVEVLKVDLQSGKISVRETWEDWRGDVRCKYWDMPIATFFEKYKIVPR